MSSELYGSLMGEAMQVAIEREKKLAVTWGEVRTLTVHDHNQGEDCTTKCKFVEVSKDGEVNIS